MDKEYGIAMYKVTGNFRGKPWIRYRKTDKQAKAVCKEQAALGSTNIGMAKLSLSELRRLRRGK